jgi:hypothetical protein
MGPTKGLELTAYSIRCAADSDSSSDLAFGRWVGRSMCR